MGLAPIGCRCLRDRLLGLAVLVRPQHERDGGVHRQGVHADRVRRRQGGQFSTHSYPYWGFGLMVAFAVVVGMVVLIRKSHFARGPGPGERTGDATRRPRLSVAAGAGRTRGRGRAPPLQPLLDAAAAGSVVKLAPGPTPVRRGQQAADPGGRGPCDDRRRRKGSVVTIATDGATVRNLRLVNSGSSFDGVDAGVQVRGNFNVISTTRSTAACSGSTSSSRAAT